MTRLLVALGAVAFLAACSKTPETSAPQAAAATPASEEAPPRVPEPTPPAAADPADHGKFTRLHAGPKDGKLVDILGAAAKRAKAEGRKLFVELGADWCEPCQAIERYIDDPRMAAAFAGTLVVKLDVAPSWGGQLEQFGLDAGSIPVWYELDEHLHATDHSIGGDAWGANIPKNMAGPLGDYFAGRDAL
ncbi:MAG: hypothetical protein EP329_10160 [Deltaproteobacteria bacterium]|nr:MAG: hypothetical protein EP329_10160 [Deltaproteobacteria bacterium]